MNRQTRVCLENAELAMRIPELTTPVPREYRPEIDDYTMPPMVSALVGAAYW